MNHCRDCNSDYATPGTCNCFAVGGKRHSAGTPVQPGWYPYTPWYPNYVPILLYTQPYWGGTSITGNLPESSDSTTITFLGNSGTTLGGTDLYNGGSSVLFFVNNSPVATPPAAS